MAVRLTERESTVRVRDAQPVPRNGGESRPFDYPHLYQIQAGDWRISYAVERNHLAILVLEVLNPDGTVQKDPVRESLTRKMKVKLLDWPTGSQSRDLRPEELGKKIKIKLLDLMDEAGRSELRPVRRGRAGDATAAAVKAPRSGRINFVDATSHDTRQPSKMEGDAGSDEETSRTVTPLDSPTM